MTTQRERDVERLNKAIQKAQEAKNREKQIRAKIRKDDRDKERKERTRRLIQTGAIVEHHAGGEIDLEQFDKLLATELKYYLESLRIKKYMTDDQSNEWNDERYHREEMITGDVGEVNDF